MPEARCSSQPKRTKVPHPLAIRPGNKRMGGAPWRDGGSPHHLTGIVERPGDSLSSKAP